MKKNSNPNFAKIPVYIKCYNSFSTRVDHQISTVWLAGDNNQTQTALKGNDDMVYARSHDFDRIQ